MTDSASTDSDSTEPAATDRTPAPTPTASLAGRVALITGAAGDLGRAAAVHLARAGASIVAADLASREAELRETVATCAQAAPPADEGPTMLPVVFDVTDPDQVATAVDQVTDAVGVPDLLYNNAGYQGAFTNTIDYDVDDFRRVLDINVTGAFVVLRAWARALRSTARPGAAVNAASMAAIGGPPNMVAYAASKAAVLGMTKTAAVDLAPAGIRVNAISPAFIGPGMMWDRQVELQAAAPSPYYGDDVETVATEMINQVPLRRYGSLDEVASVVRFLLSDEASYLTGINIEIAGGAS
ncbi:MAG: SDR family oxidoreductase [Actinomycetota bacterium]